MRFAKTAFTVAGIWGLFVLTPLYFSFELIGRLDPPPITHPDFFYGFVAVALTWQVVFLVIGREPIRFRPMMVPAMLEKFLYVSTLTALWMRGRLGAGAFVAAVPDFVLGIFFAIAYRKLQAGRDRGAGHDRAVSSAAEASHRLEGHA
jgi:O-antigen/teichoic acid export membrane protein